MSQDERQLTASVCAGEAQGFRKLYDLYGSRILGYVVRLTGNREEAEDIVQEVFVAAYAGRGAFQNRARLLSWLLGIATRRWRDRSRRRSPQTASLELIETTHFSPPAGRHGEVEQSVVDAVTLTRALARLEPAFREALLLVKSQGLTYGEAAEILNEPVGTVKWRVSEAIRRMQEILEKVEGEFDEMQQISAKPDPCAGLR